jgi:hypothetical protein
MTGTAHREALSPRHPALNDDRAQHGTRLQEGRRNRKALVVRGEGVAPLSISETKTAADEGSGTHPGGEEGVALVHRVCVSAVVVLKL